MIALRLETVLVGDESDCVLLAVGCEPRDCSANHQNLILGAGISHFGLFSPLHAVAGFVTVER